MNCRDFTAEFEERGVLSDAAQFHLNDCSGCRKTTVVQTHIWKAIDDFPPIDAPKNFNFTVKARIANHRPTDFQPVFLPVLRYVLPFSAIVLVLGLLAFNTSFFFGGDSATQTAQVVPPTPVVAENPSDNFSLPAQSVAGNNSAQSFTDERFFVESANQSVKPSGIERRIRYVPVNSKRKPAVAPRRVDPKDDSNGGGSRVIASTTTRVLTPPEFNPSKTPVMTSSDNRPQPIADGNIWSFIGIEIVLEKGSRTVKAVKPNSLAARVGVKVGDVIGAVNGVKLSSEPLNKEKFEIKSLTVLRGTERVEITFKN